MMQSVGHVRRKPEAKRRLTEFPMTRILLLEVLRSKAGKASAERTGHLGGVDLILAAHISQFAGEQTERYITYILDHVAPTRVRGQFKYPKVTKTKDIQVGVSNTFFNGTPFDTTPSAPPMASMG